MTEQAHQAENYTFGSVAKTFLSSVFRILPLALRGSVSGQNTTFTGTLKAASLPATKLREFLLGGVHAGLEVHDRAGFLAQRVVRDRDDGGVHDGRMLVERVLDLDAVDVLAAADQHVLGAVDDVAEAFLVQAGEIAGLDPAIDKGLAPWLRACSSSP